ncbi:MAG: gluconate 2-dehydrogenase subunit 3 family protein [Prolixibacteraceae bacterium]
MIQNRRDFIRTLGLAYGSILLAPGCSISSGTHYRVFTKPEAGCLIALCEQIIPADHDPGATDAGVINFIDKQTYLRFPDDLKIYRQGIDSLQAFCHAKYGKLFEELEGTTQEGILKEMERNKLPEEYWPEVKQSAFFSLVINRTMQGFYGPPRHGGNKDYVSYRMMKLDYPLLIGQNRYKNGK